MSTDLATLLQTQTVEEIFAILLASYQAAGFPVQSWQSGGVERTRLMAISTALLDLSANYLPTITAGGFVDLASADWLPLLAQQTYNLDQLQAEFTVGTITLTAATGVGPVNVQSGKTIVVFAASGNRYILNEDGTIPLSGSVELSFTAEFSGASYNDPSSSGSISLVTPIPGVTPTNPAGDYSDVAHVGAGTGSVVPGGTPVGFHSVTVRIDTTGDAGVATWSYQLDGAPYVSVGPSVTETDIGGTGIDITLTDDETPSFIIGDTYTFNTPGSWITSQGSDIETSASLAARCKGRWSTLSVIGNSDLYELLIKSVPGVGTQVTQVIVQPDANINNKLNIIVAGPGGVLPADTISDLQTWISARVPITVNPVVISPTPLTITLTGTVTCQASLFTAVEAAIETAMLDYFVSVPINGTVRISTIIEKIMEVTGVIDVDASTVKLNGTASNLILGNTVTFQLADLDTPTGLTYVTQ